jgi:twitching motility protein PilT
LEPRKIRRVSKPRADEAGGASADEAEVVESEDLPDLSGVIAPEAAARIHASERRLDEIMRRLKTVTDDAARAIGKAVQMSDELETLKNETLENMQVAFDENAEILEAIEKDVTELKKTLAAGTGKDVEEKVNKALGEVRAEIAALEAKASGNVEERLAELEQKAGAELNKIIEEMQSRFAEVEKKSSGEEMDMLLDELEKTRSEFTAELNALKEETGKVTQSLPALEKKMQAEIERADLQLEEAREELNKALAQMQEQLGESNPGEALAALAAKVEEAIKHSSELETNLLELGESQKAGGALSADAEQKLNTVVKQVNDLEGKLESELEKSRDAFSKVETALGAAARAEDGLARLEKMEGQLSKATTEVSSMMQKVQEASLQFELINERIAAGLKAIDDVDDRVRRAIGAASDIGGGFEEFEAFSTDGELGFELNDLLQVMIKHQASDLHLKVGAPPTVRLDGELIPVGDQVLTENDCKRLILGNISKHQRRKLYERKELDFAYSIPNARFRINAFMTRGTVSAALRMLRQEMPSIEQLGLPPVLQKLASYNNGLILITGPAGSGKSTTLASMIDYINTTKKMHVITVEDPIEFVHTDKLSIITQREIGADTTSFPDAIKQALRQDPNVVLIGEMRDPETIMTAVQAAETGHLVLSTLHTPNTVQAIDRIIDVFSGETQNQFRLLLANTLRGVVSQRLLTRADEQGRVPAVEVLVVTSTISSCILDGKTNEIYQYLQQGASEGMQTFTASLTKLYEAGLITKEEALYHADQPTEFRLGVEGHSTGGAAYAEGDTLMNWL